MTRSTVLRWVWFVVCAALAVVAGCATPVHVTWSAHAGDWSGSGTLQLRLDPTATNGELLVVREVSREAWPTPSEWAYREARGLPLPGAPPAPAGRAEAGAPESEPRRSAPDLRRGRASVSDAPRVKFVRGKVAPAPATTATTAAARTPSSPTASSRVAATSAPAAVAPRPAAAPAPAISTEPRASHREELAMLAAILALALGTIAVPFMVSRRRRAG